MKSRLNVTAPQADAENNDVDDVAVLRLVVGADIGVVNDDLIMLPVVDGTDVCGPSEGWSVG